MSLVGTRPILQDELRQYELHHRARIAIKPGITGMWQVSGRSDITDFEEVVRLDKDGKMEVLKAYPEGEERRAINAVFDEIVADLKREQILTHSDVTLPLPTQPLAENEQISIFTAERPSVMAQLAAAKPAEKTTPAQAAPKKSRVPEI